MEFVLTLNDNPNTNFISLEVYRNFDRECEIRIVYEVITSIRFMKVLLQMNEFSRILSISSRLIMTK